MAKIYLDPGHGGNDPGASGNALFEKNVVLSISKLLKVELERQGHSVKLCREDDKTVSLIQRTNEANAWGADIFVSIHNNAYNGSAYGIETYCYKFKYRTLADKIHSAILDARLYYSDRGVKEGNFHVIRESSMNAALIELAFIDNSRDSELLKNKQKEFAIAICKGIQNYFGLPYKEEEIKKPQVENSNTFYRVCVGSFKDRENADRLVAELKSKGYNAFITLYEP